MPNASTQITTEGVRLQEESGPIDAFALKRLGMLELQTVDSLLNADAGAGRRLGAYVHVPFCFHKCHYCDFYSIVDSRDRQGVFTDRMIAELNAAAELLPARVSSIFVGGGTPTLLEVAHWRRLLPVMHETLQPVDDFEFTVEANPETVTPELARVLTDGGVNRVSIGAQSFNVAHLKALERWHEPVNVGKAVRVFRDAGIESINLDLIFAIPGQSLDDWLRDLDAALALDPSHLSCYGLTYEPNTPLTKKMQMGAVTPTDDALEAQMYVATMDRLAAAGYEHYEVSAWAKPGRRCEHNLIYWTNGNWWPIGPSASGHINGTRWKNVPRLGEYLDLGPLPRIQDVERLDDDGRIGEELMLGLRLIEGIELSRIKRLLAMGTRAAQRHEVIERFTRAGLLEQMSDRLRFTRAGLLLADTVLEELI